jgi:SulP family sulfate permease
MRVFIQDFIGAFGDLPVLLPLLILLSSVPGYSAPILLASAALTSFFSAVWFRIPVSVQPLKSVAIAALALGASGEEIRLSGMLIGLCFATLAVTRKELLPIPDSIVRAVQAGLGALLIKQGFASATGLSPLTQMVCVLVTLFFFIFGRKTRIPLLGIGALLAFVEALVSGRAPEPYSGPVPSELRPGVLLALILPQLALSTLNSVRGARLALEQYFGSKDPHRTERKLLFSIGIGNLFAGLFHGLPFCHGAGGITAHWKAGAESYRMNLVLGTLLGALAVISHFSGAIPSFHAFPLSSLLGLIGLHHFALSSPMVNRGPSGVVLVLGSAIIAAGTGNLLFSLAFAIVVEGFRHLHRGGAAHA